MSVRRWDPFAELMSMRQMVDRLLEESWGRVRRPLGERGGPLVLPVDLYETDDSYIVKAALAGAKPEDVDISVLGNTLTIRGEIKPESDVPSESYLYQERLVGPFFRELSLPFEVQADKAVAKFEDGVLTLTLPKSEQARPKQIKIKPE